MPAKPTPALDPYLTLGLESGAPMAEVKRAYRQLAKAFHPDSAGERATPRFLAIQAAYEQIRTGRVTLGGARAGRGSAASTPGGGSAAGASSEPWRADPARARAARERARAGGAGSRGAGAGSGAGASSGTGGASGRGSEGRASAGAGAAGSTGTSGTTGTTGTGKGSGARRRATRKATMGSTSYDEARDPADPTWGGASWYGPSSGEYWIVNPREYADPRKHGPDYQQRARRLAQEQAATRLDGVADEPARSTPDEPPAESTPYAEGRPRASAPPREVPRPRSTPRWASDAPRPAPRAWAGDAPPATPRPDDAPAPFRWLGAPADDPVRRLGLALVAWPPIGLALAALIGEATGCASFGARCDGAEPMLPWLAQAVVLGLLLLLPPVTRILAFGTVAVLVGLVPITAFLLAVGASGAPQAGAALAVLLAAIWAVGVALALALRVRRLPAWPAGGRGSPP